MCPKTDGAGASKWVLLKFYQKKRDGGFHSSGMIFRQNITGNWRLTGAGGGDWSMRRRACED